MKYSLPSSYYREIAENISHHVVIFWDEGREQFLDEDGFEIHNIHEYVPQWALDLAYLQKNTPEKYFCFTPNSWTLVEIFWPDEDENENWYQ